MHHSDTALQRHSRPLVPQHTRMQCRKREVGFDAKALVKIEKDLRENLNTFTMRYTEPAGSRDIHQPLRCALARSLCFPHSWLLLPHASPPLQQHIVGVSLQPIATKGCVRIVKSPSTMRCRRAEHRRRARSLTARDTNQGHSFPDLWRDGSLVVEPWDSVDHSCFRTPLRASCGE